MLYIILGILSLVGTYLVRWVSIKNAILDIPNDRSSHSVAVPRGGGVAIISVFYIGLFYLKDILDIQLVYALLSALPIVFISLIDDIYTISSKIRFIVQAVSSIMALFALGGVDSIDFGFLHLIGPWVNIIAFIAILWLTNLYNFLDGIDGYAGMETVSVGLGIFLLFDNPLGLVLIVASLGFLIFNWHKASIFMGDVGSATLGFIFAVFVFSDTGDGNIYVWLTLLSLFWVDATVTLLHRYFNNENLTHAHKKHAYQRLTQSGWSHSKVTIVAFSINMIFIGLLYIWNAPLKVFLINILTLIIVWVFINKKKRFA